MIEITFISSLLHNFLVLAVIFSIKLTSQVKITLLINKLKMVVIILNNNMFSLGLIAILLTSVYTAMLASLLMTTKNRVDYLYYREKNTGN